MSATSEPSLLPAATEARQEDTLILALGNPLRGDDGVAQAVLEGLSISGEVPRGVTLCDGGTPGLEAALLPQAYRRAIVIDAADMGLAPGGSRRLTLGPGELHPGATLHAAGLREALALAEALGIPAA
ncbi:MAG: hydrogenase maturation protease [Chloroflexota bacterium]